MAGAGAGLAGGFRQEDKPERVLYMKVENLEAAVKKVVAAGGRVLIPPTHVPNVIDFALFEDPQGTAPVSCCNDWPCNKTRALAVAG
ncbi:MAG: hypothetical protein HY048_13485 [Acidobacteria bacterium]|nr:hypothetical protein [Acidobacteriota bacterium]